MRPHFKIFNLILNYQYLNKIHKNLGITFKKCRYRSQIDILMNSNQFSEVNRYDLHKNWYISAEIIVHLQCLFQI